MSAKKKADAAKQLAYAMDSTRQEISLIRTALRKELFILQGKIDKFRECLAAGAMPEPGDSAFQSLFRAECGFVVLDEKLRLIKKVEEES